MFQSVFQLGALQIEKNKDQNVTIPLLLAQVKVLLQRLLKVQLTLKIDFKKDSAMSILFAWEIKTKLNGVGRGPLWLALYPPPVKKKARGAGWGL